MFEVHNHLSLHMGCNTTRKHTAASADAPRLHRTPHAGTAAAASAAIIPTLPRHPSRRPQVVGHSAAPAAPVGAAAQQRASSPSCPAARPLPAQPAPARWPRSRPLHAASSPAAPPPLSAPRLPEHASRRRSVSHTASCSCNAAAQGGMAGATRRQLDQRVVLDSCSLLLPPPLPSSLSLPGWHFSMWMVIDLI